MGAIPAKKARDPAIYQKMEKVKSQLDRLISRMQKEQTYTPTRDDIEKYAIDINDILMKNREKVRKFESYLKAAIIDLTEIPEMMPQMQRISFLTALKDASHKLQLFMDCC